MPSVAEVFRSLPVVRRVESAAALPAAAAAYRWDEMTLDWEQRAKARSRRMTTGGVAFATALPRGTVLREGDVLVLPALGINVRVVECAERVLVVRPSDAMEAARWAYHIGNSHSPLMLENGLLICLELPGMSQLLQYHRIPFERAERPFTPLGESAGHRHRSPQSGRGISFYA